MSGPVLTRPRNSVQGQNLRLFVPAMQAAGSGVPVDRSSNAFGCVLGSGLTDANIWRNPGYATTNDANAGTDASFSYDSAAFDWDAANGDSFILFCVMQRPTAPTAERPLLGTFGGASPRGLRISLSTTGGLKAGLSDGTNTVLGTGSGASSICDGQDWPVAVWWDSNQRELICQSNGTENVGNAYTVTGSTLAGGRLYFGNSGTGTSAGSLAVRFRCIQLYTWKARALPNQFRRGIDRLRAMPHHVISDWSAL